MRKFVIEFYWEPSNYKHGIWEQSLDFPDEYTERKADEILDDNRGVMEYRKKAV
jgi:hypothetical protein